MTPTAQFVDSVARPSAPNHLRDAAWLLDSDGTDLFQEWDREGAIMESSGPETVAFTYRLALLAKLRDGWDGGTARRPVPRLVSRMWVGMGGLPERMAVIGITSEVDGSVSAEWEEGEGFASVRLLEDDTILFIAERENELVERRMPFDLVTLQALLGSSTNA